MAKNTIKAKIICSWCGKYMGSKLVADSPAYEGMREGLISHTICTDCSIIITGPQKGLTHELPKQAH